MIDIVNGQFMTDDERRASLFRAMHTQPFINLFTFPVGLEAVKRQEYEDKLDVNKDFFLTEILGNFDETFGTTNTLFDVSIYATLNQGSVYKYMQTINLPSGFIAQQARAATILFANQLFDDKQKEYMPYKIRAGDRVIARVQNREAKAAAFELQLALKGYYVFPNRYTTPNTTRGVSESLARPIRYEEWAIPLTDGRKTVTFDNDRTARVVLGFMFRDTATDRLASSVATIEIVDSFRNLKWMNKPIPIEFLAPRVGTLGSGVRDTHIYYLPIEYLFEPFSSLQCLIDCDLLEDLPQLTMLTRTV